MEWSTTSSSVRVFLLAALLPFEAVEPHMGTLVRIKLYASTQALASQAFHAAFDRIEELNRALSDYLPDSELNRVTRDAVNRPVRVGGDLFRVLDASQQLAERSGGAFDITVGPITHLWRAGKLPDPETIARCGYRKLHLDPARQTVILDQPGMQLDLGAIAKGYVADQALAEIARLGIQSALVAASGDLAFSDPPPGQRGWKVRLLLADAQVVELSNAAVSTSGATEQHLDFNGRRYSHIVNPATGLGLTEDIRVTVIARRGIEADGLATAIGVLGRERGMALLRHYPGASAYVILKE